MINFTFPWTKRREARLAAEQMARQEAAFVSAIVAVSMRGFERAQRARASAIEPKGPADVVGWRYDGATGESSTIYRSTDEASSRSWSTSSSPAQLASGGSFDGAGASGDWNGSACSPSGSESSSGSSDSGSSCSSD